MFNIFNREFDFCQYLIDSGFKEKEEYPLVRIFQLGEIEITVYNLKIVKGYNTVSIDFKNHNIATLKFIPTSKVMSRELLVQTMEEANGIQSQATQ